MTKHTSSSSEEEERYAMMDERKRKRMISNRESARRSRMRRETHIKDLTNQITVLRNSNNEIAQKISLIDQQFLAVESENQVLRVQQDELTKRLESLEIMSSYLCVNNPVPEYYSQPWQLPLQPMPLMASVGMFQI
ncbi:hypothetical protein NMG60_11032956 [Bertholletia excelsa]